MDSRLFYQIGLALLLFLVVPGNVIGENLEDFSFVDAKVLYLILLGAIVVGLAALYGLSALVFRTRAARSFELCLRYCFFYVLVNGLYIPVSLVPGMEDAANAGLKTWSFLLAVSIATAVFIICLSRVGVYLFTFIFIVFSINIALASYGLYSLSTVNAEANIRKDNLDKGIFRVSAKKNIFVIGFDGLPRDTALAVINANENLQRVFADFVAFKNVISSSPATSASVAAELYGNIDFKARAETEEELWLLETERLITNYLDANGVDVSTYFAYSKEFNDEDNAFGIGDLADFGLVDKVRNALHAYHYILVRVGTKFAVQGLAQMDLVGPITSALRILGLEEGISDESLAYVTNLENSQGPDWDDGLLTTLLDYTAYVKNIAVGDSEFSAHFAHFVHTHYPVNFDSACRFRSDDRAWHEAHQNEEGVKNEVYCALTQLAEFLERLKALGAYDQSLIVLKSDHGKPAYYFDDNKMASFKIRNSVKWGYNRYTPMLLIKDFGSRRNSLEIDDSAVMIDDLARTLCVNSGIDAPCDHYPGYDLLANDLTVSEDAESVIFVVKDEKSDYTFVNHNPLYLNRKKDFFRNINDVLVSEILSKPVECGVDIPFSQSAAFNNGNSDYESWVSWRAGASHFLKVRIGFCPRRSNVAISVAGMKDVAPKATLLVNGEARSENPFVVGDAGRESTSATHYRIEIGAGDVDAAGSVLIEIVPRDLETEIPLRFLGLEFD